MSNSAVIVRVAVGLLVIALGALVLWLLFFRGPTATARPETFDPESISTAPLSAIRGYDSTLLHYDSVLGADRQIVDSGLRPARVGDTAWIQPEVGAYRLTIDALAEGRIIARIKSKVEQPRWGVGPWWTWWCVDRRGPHNTWRSLFIADHERPAYRVSRDSALELEMHPGSEWRQPLARFTGSIWGNCCYPSACCCKQY